MASSASQTHAFPPAVAAVLKSHSGAEGSVDGATGLAWVFSKKDLYVWMYDEGRDAEVHVRTLPYSSTRRHFVSMALHESPARLSVVLCSDDGNLAMWPDFCGNNAVETQRLAGPITAAAAAPMPGGAFVACAATAATAIVCVRARPSPGGLQTSVSRLTEAAGTALAGQQPGMLGRLFAWGGAAAPAAPSGPSTETATAMQFVAGPRGSLRLLVLTTSALDCWQVDGEGEQLLWSQKLKEQLQQRLHAHSLSLLDLTIVPAARGFPRQAAILASSVPSDDEDGELSAHIVDIGGSSPALQAWQLLTGVEVNSKFRFNASLDAEAFLLWWSGGLPIEWTPIAGAEWLETPGNCLAASISRENTWMVLTPSGVVEIPVEGPVDESEGMQPSMPSIAPEQEQSSRRDADVGPLQQAHSRVVMEEVFAILDEAAAAGAVSPSGYQRLRSAGAFHGEGLDNAVAKYSSRLADVLPKHWGGPVGGAEVAEQLATKKLSHDSLLLILGDAGVLSQLAAPALRVIMENGERLATVAAVREAENRLLSARSRPGTSTALALLQHVISLAGQQCMPQVAAPVEDRSSWEVFYSYPSISAPAFFDAAAAAVQQRPDSDTSAADAFEDLHELAKAVQGGLHAALTQRGWQAQRFPAEVARALRGCRSPEWLVQEAPRSALLSLSEALVNMRLTLQSVSPERAAEAVNLLLGLAERLLNAFAAAIPATDPSESAAVERLVQQYAAARGEILQHALDQAIAFCMQGDSCGEALLQRVESLAQAHAAHAQLFDLCEFLGDRARLHDHMAANAPEDPYAHETAAQYVFGRLVREGRQAELLSLPEAFSDELHAWLLRQEQTSEITELRWQHELRMRDYGRAAATLARVAAAARGGRPHFARSGHAACLAKLALLAGQPGGLAAPSRQAVQGSAEMDRILTLLAVQERLGLAEEGPLPPRALADAAIQASSSAPEDVDAMASEAATAQQDEAALLVFDVLAAAGKQLNGNARGVLEAAWRRALAATDWDALAADRARSSDAEFGRRLGATLVARAAARCFSPFPEHRVPLEPSAAIASPEEVAALLKQLHTGSSPAALSDILAAFELGCTGGSLGLLPDDDPMGVF
ncbi:Nuclear pore complex protein NUP133 [Coccomyxa sp. Obi]|nr:Nuclear pore complex protein NUP133 [Coccomyxa sp. Obi]